MQPAGIQVLKVGGAFRTRNGQLAMIYVIPRDEFDEVAFLRMIESIRAPEGDSAPDDPPKLAPRTNGASSSGGDSHEDEPAEGAKSEDGA